jgi:hypothetical protein
MLGYCKVVDSRSGHLKNQQRYTRQANVGLGLKTILIMMIIHYTSSSLAVSHTKSTRLDCQDQYCSMTILVSGWP